MRPTEVQGELTLHGVTKPVTLTISSFKCMAHPMKKDQSCAARTRTPPSIARTSASRWGKNFGFDMKVKLAIQVEATGRQSKRMRDRWSRMCAAPVSRGSGAADRNAGAPLFDGKTLNGWKQLGGAADYQVIDGAIVGATRPGVPNSFLVTQQDFADFILEFDVRQDVGPANSGVQFRSHSTPEFENGRVHGYQADIDPSPRQWSGHIYEEAQRGWFYTGEMNPPSKALYKFGAWNHYRIEAIGPRLRVWVNDGAVADVIDAALDVGIHRPAGAFDRQTRGSRTHHQLEESRRSGPSDLKPRAADGHLHPQQPAQQPGRRGKGAGLAAVVGWQDGEGLAQRAGARVFRRRAGRWRTASSRCSRKAGGGDIMTDEEFGAFELQMEFKVSAGANSGIFYLLTSPHDPASNAPLGLEYQILDDERHPDAKLGVTAIARWPRSTTCCRARS